MKNKKISHIRQLEPLSYWCFCCFLISCAARPPHRVGLPYMLERAGLDVQQGTVNLLSTFPFVAWTFSSAKGFTLHEHSVPLSYSSSSSFHVAQHFSKFFFLIDTTFSWDKRKIKIMQTFHTTMGINRFWHSLSLIAFLHARKRRSMYILWTIFANFNRGFYYVCVCVKVEINIVTYSIINTYKKEAERSSKKRIYIFGLPLSDHVNFLFSCKSMRL